MVVRDCVRRVMKNINFSGTVDFLLGDVKITISQIAMRKMWDFQNVGGEKMWHWKSKSNAIVKNVMHNSR